MRKSQGFTLLEVMVTISVIGVGLVLLIHAFFLVSHGHLTSKTHTKAFFLLEQKIHEIRNQRDFKRQEEGKFSDPDSRYQFKVLQKSLDNKDFRKVQVSVFWNERDEVKEISALTIVRMPFDEKNSGVTFIELLLTIAIVSIIFLSLQRTVAYAMRVQRTVNQASENDALRIFYTLSKDLRSSYLTIDPRSSIKFIGSASSLKFYATENLNYEFKDNDSDIKLTQYYLSSLNEIQRTSLMNSKTSVGGEEQVGRMLSSQIHSIKFSFFDGSQWAASWNSSEKLPQAVKASLWFSGQSNEPITTIVYMPGVR